MFVLLAGATFAGSLPRFVTLLAGGVALGALLAAFLFNLEAGRVGSAQAEREERQKQKRARAADVADVDPTTIGVDAAAQTILPGDERPTYVPRHVDRELDAALESALEDRGPWIVVAFGPSKVGKSRSLFEALVRCRERRPLRLIAPRDAAALHEITPADVDPPPGGEVLWLDDLEPFLGNGVTLASLRDWHAGIAGRVVAATYGGKGNERVATDRAQGLASLADELFRIAARVPVNATTDAEVGALRHRLPDAEFALLGRHGLAAYLVAAPALERKLYSQRHSPGDPECPGGVALVYAAADWVRCGRTDPVSRDILRRAWPYQSPSIPDTDPGFETALAWATRPVAGTVALVQPDGDGFYAYDYVAELAHDRPRARSPAPALWEQVLGTAEPEQALPVAAAAYYFGLLDTAESALERARASSADAIASVAGFNLGFLLHRAGRAEDAIDAYGEVVSRYGGSSDPQVRERVAMALLNQGATLADLGRSHDAIDTCDVLIAMFADDEAPGLRQQVGVALVNKGIFLGVQGEDRAAIALFDRVIEEFGSLEVRARALFAKAVRLGSMNRLDEEVAVYEELERQFGGVRGEPMVNELLVRALVNKGMQLVRLDRREEAIESFDAVAERVADSTDPELERQLSAALRNKAAALGVLDRRQQRLATLGELIRRFVDSADPVQQQRVAAAAIDAGLALANSERHEESMLLYDTVLARYGESDDSVLREHVANALIYKAAALRDLGRPDEAMALLDEIERRFCDSDAPELESVVSFARSMREAPS